MRSPELALKQILDWADAWYRRFGDWPRVASGRIPHSLGEKWNNIDQALRLGLRGLPGKSSLPRLLEEKRRARNHLHLPRLSIKTILAWADAQFRRSGAWPHSATGAIPEAPAETWSAVNTALEQGNRGLPGGSSLARLLARHRNVRNIAELTRLTVRQILTWADAHFERDGSWPLKSSGHVIGTKEETWSAVDTALSKGNRGLAGGTTLTRVLALFRGVRNPTDLPALTIQQILGWVDAYHRRHGKWPLRSSGPIPQAPDDTWLAIDKALRKGTRQLPGDSSLAGLLARRRGVRNIKALPRLTIKQVLSWADEHYHRTGVWPTRNSGAIPATEGETWDAVATALWKGRRGFPKGLSLARLLARYRKVPHRLDRPRLTIGQILTWADGYHRLHGKWPNRESGPIASSLGDTWNAIDSALIAGSRGLPGGSSLAQLLAQRRGRRNKSDLPHFTTRQILTWADAHHRRTGHWPTQRSGPVAEAPGETWRGIWMALYQGIRGLPGGTTLRRLLIQHGKIKHDEVFLSGGSSQLPINP